MTAIALQPALRPLMMFDTLPEGCISFFVTDAYSLPHIRPGESVVVDTRDNTIRQGEVYLIQWTSGRRQICQARKSMRSDSWYVGAMTNPEGRAASDTAFSRYQETGQLYHLGWSDSPYDDLSYLESKIIGAMIGIFQPTFEEPRRIVSCG